MSLDLNKLENKLDEALSNETSESLNRFLNDKRMSSKQQTAVDYFELELSKLNFDEITKENCWFYIIPIYDKAKEMEKEKMIEFAQEVFRNRYNQITQSLGNIADDIYNETYGGGEQ